jgi:hypothetical protein
MENEKTLSTKHIYFRRFSYKKVRFSMKNVEN